MWDGDQARWNRHWLNAAKQSREFLTNARKVTVSVLYWYEELPEKSGNFWKEIFGSFFCARAPLLVALPRGAARWRCCSYLFSLWQKVAVPVVVVATVVVVGQKKGYGTQGSQVITDLSTN